jgi:mono/diheme cytochrome c family protein
MTRKLNLSIVLGSILFIFACGPAKQEQPTSESTQDNKSLMSDEGGSASNEAADARGIGKFTNVELGPTLDVAMSKQGKAIYDLKCSACHKLTKEKLVGPGWSGVTSRRKPEWVMNFATNPDEMLNKDPQAQAMLEECLVRMPNQNLNDADARAVYEYMRENDGVK